MLETSLKSHKSLRLRVAVSSNNQHLLLQQPKIPLLNRLSVQAPRILQARQYRPRRAHIKHRECRKDPISIGKPPRQIHLGVVHIHYQIDRKFRVQTATLRKTDKLFVTFQRQRTDFRRADGLSSIVVGCPNSQASQLKVGGCSRMLFPTAQGFIKAHTLVRRTTMIGLDDIQHSKRIQIPGTTDTVTMIRSLGQTPCVRLPVPLNLTSTLSLHDKWDLPTQSVGL